MEASSNPTLVKTPGREGAGTAFGNPSTIGPR